MFEDDLFSKRLEEAEFTLLEEYANGDLPEDERASVASWVAASPRAQAQVAVTETLRKAGTAATAAYIKPRRQRSTPLFLWPLAAAAALACAVAVPLWQHRHVPSAERVMTARVPSAPANPLPSGQDTILLQAQRLRGGTPARAEAATFTLHPGFATRLQILVPRSQSDALYSLDLHASSPQPGGTPIHAEGLRTLSEGSISYVELLVLPSSLTPGHYAGELRSRDGSYALGFSVVSAVKP